VSGDRRRRLQVAADAAIADGAAGPSPVKPKRGAKAENRAQRRLLSCPKGDNRPRHLLTNTSQRRHAAASTALSGPGRAASAVEIGGGPGLETEETEDAGAECKGVGVLGEELVCTRGSLSAR